METLYTGELSQCISAFTGHIYWPCHYLFTLLHSDTVFCLSFLLSVLCTPGNQAIFRHANNSYATSLFPSFSSLLPLPIQSPFLLLSSCPRNSCQPLLFFFHTQFPFSLWPKLFSLPLKRGFTSLFFSFFLFYFFFPVQPINQWMIYL